MLLKETLTKTLGSKEFIDACWRNLARDFLRDLTITKWRTRIEIEDDNSFIETSKTAMESRSYLCMGTFRLGPSTVRMKLLSQRYS